MDYGTKLFWLLIALLLGASVRFGLGVQEQRRGLVTKEATLESGQLVTLERVIDGDTISVKNEAGEKIVVRVLGIKSFESQPEKDPASRYGKMAVDLTKELAGQAPLRVLLASPPKDRHGRTVATVIVGDRDLALELVKRGLTLVYPVYPFPAMPLYLEEQERAHAAGRGLWGDATVARRAESLLREWRSRTE